MKAFKEINIYQIIRFCYMLNRIMMQSYDLLYKVEFIGFIDKLKVGRLMTIEHRAVNGSNTHLKRMVISNEPQNCNKMTNS